MNMETKMFSNDLEIEQTAGMRIILIIREIK